MERVMEFVNLETDLRNNLKFEHLNELHKESRHVWQDLLLEFGQDKYLETGFMIFMTDHWMKEFAKFSGVTVPKLRQILELFSEKKLVVSKLFSEKILFSENFLRNHIGFFSKYEKKFRRRREKFANNIKLFLEIRESNSGFSMTYDDIVKYFDNTLDTCLNRKTVHNNNNNNKNNNKNINLDSNESDFQLTPIEDEKPPLETVKEFAEIVNEANQFDRESWQYGYAKHVEKILKERDPNSPKQNLQQGARYFDDIFGWGYSQSQIENVIYFFQQELNKASPSYPAKRITTFHDFKQFFRKLFGMCQNGIKTDYERKAAEIADKV